MRQAPQQVGKGGVKVAAVNQDSGSGLRIRSKK
jgi:hypothetical protein